MQPETLVLNVSGRILMVNRENNGNTTDQLVSSRLTSIYYLIIIPGVVYCSIKNIQCTVPISKYTN